jgi:hypothetical protein
MTDTGAASSCTFNNQSISSGQSVTAYQAASVAFGATCTSQTRTCTNGTLSGTYVNPSCIVGAAQSCTFNNQSLSNGGSVTAYQSSSVAFGASCLSETRICANGTLSGSFVQHLFCERSGLLCIQWSVDRTRASGHRISNILSVFRLPMCLPNTLLFKWSTLWHIHQRFVQRRKSGHVFLQRADTLERTIRHRVFAAISSFRIILQCGCGDEDVYQRYAKRLVHQCGVYGCCSCVVFIQ